MKIFCIGRNYAEHARELNNAVPEEPVVFIKPKTALYQTHVPFYYPEFCNELHHEIEIVFRVCKNGRYIPENHAYKYINAVTVGIDFTARDLQADLKSKGLPWEKAKAWDNSAVIGKWVELQPEELRHHRNFSLLKNDEVVQQGNTKDMIFNYQQIIANISKYFSLNIGDLIFTGTPAGVGECSVGDYLEGYLENEKMFQLEIK